MPQGEQGPTTTGRRVRPFLCAHEPSTWSRQLSDHARMRESVPLIVAVNNHFSGHAPENIQALIDALG